MDKDIKTTLKPGSFYSVPNDEFLNWLRFINPGILVKGNVELFAYCVEHLPSASPIIEIGSFAGLSLNHILYFLRRSDCENPVFSIDEWRFEGAQPNGIITGSSASFDAYRMHVIDTFRRNISLFSADRLPHHFELSSDAFFVEWREREHTVDFFGNRVQLGGNIAFAYIDGDHTYEQSKKDFENIDRHLEVGGFIIFDDSAPLSRFGCKRTAEEAASLARYEVVVRNPNYCLRKRAV
jgi:Methyltransferase domain